jgi:hypothetical protein
MGMGGEKTKESGGKRYLLRNQMGYSKIELVAKSRGIKLKKPPWRLLV